MAQGLSGADLTPSFYSCVSFTKHEPQKDQTFLASWSGSQTLSDTCIFAEVHYQLPDNP